MILPIHDQSNSQSVITSTIRAQVFRSELCFHDWWLYHFLETRLVSPPVERWCSLAKRDGGWLFVPRIPTNLTTSPLVSLSQPPRTESIMFTYKYKDLSVKQQKNSWNRTEIPVSTTVQLSSLYMLLISYWWSRGEKADPFRWCPPTHSLSQVVTYSQLTEQSQPSFLQISDTIASVPRAWNKGDFKEVRHLFAEVFLDVYFLLLLFVLWWESLKHLGSSLVFF